MKTTPPQRLTSKKHPSSNMKRTITKKTKPTTASPKKPTTAPRVKLTKKHTSDSPKLSDQTRIAKTTWAKLKEFAMHKNIHEQSWYFEMTGEEKELLAALISAQ